MKIKILILFLIIIKINIVYANELNIPKQIIDDNIICGKNYGKVNFVLRKAIKGNFSNSGYEECIAFYYRPEKKKSDEAYYECIKIYVLDKNRIINEYRILHESYFDYSTGNDFDLKQIKELEQHFGPWNGYFYTYDLNGNGYPEIFLFDSSGIGCGFGIWEYDKEKDKFEPIIKAEETVRYYRLIVNKKERSFTFFNEYEPKANEYRYIGIQYKWNDKLKKYKKRVIKKGLTFEEVLKIKGL